jgi:hypothetical protein
MKQHELKTWPEYFEALREGKKTFEIRENDRGFETGDILILKEFDPCEDCNGTGRVSTGCGDCDSCGCKAPHGKYTGRTIKAEVMYLLDDCWGLDEKYVAMSIRKIWFRKG